MPASDPASRAWAVWENRDDAASGGPAPPAVVRRSAAPGSPRPRPSWASAAPGAAPGWFRPRAPPSAGGSARRQAARVPPASPAPGRRQAPGRRVADGDSPVSSRSRTPLLRPTTSCSGPWLLLAFATTDRPSPGFTSEATFLRSREVDDAPHRVAHGRPRPPGAGAPPGKRRNLRRLPRPPAMEGVAPTPTAARAWSASPVARSRAASRVAARPPTALPARCARRSSASAVLAPRSAASPRARAFRGRPGSSRRCPRGRSTHRDSCPGTAGGSPRRRRTPAPHGSRC